MLCKLQISPRLIPYSLKLQQYYIFSQMESIMVNQKYLVRQKLGEGTFGKVYEVQLINSLNRFAIKEQNKYQTPSKLIHQAKIYRKLMLKNNKNVCNIYEVGMHDSWNYMVMDKLSFPLNKLFSNCKKSFTPKTVCIIAKKAIQQLKNLHQQGYVHRDLKPENFMVGSSQNSRAIYLIDLGLTKLYINPKTGKHIQRKGGKSLIGTPRFASISSHDGFEQSRKDDLCSLGYMMLYFLRGDLPWQGLDTADKSLRLNQMAHIKKSLSQQELWKGYPKFFLDFWNYINSLQFQSEPNYQHMKSILPQFKDEVPDWEKPFHHRKLY